MELVIVDLYLNAVLEIGQYRSVNIETYQTLAETVVRFLAVLACVCVFAYNITSNLGG